MKVLSLMPIGFFAIRGVLWMLLVVILDFVVVVGDVGEGADELLARFVKTFRNALSSTPPSDSPYFSLRRVPRASSSYDSNSFT